MIAIPLGILASIKKGLFQWFSNGWYRLFSGLPVVFSAALLLSMPFLLLHEHRFYWSIAIIALIEVGRVSEIFRVQTENIAKQPYIEAGITMGAGPVTMIKNYYIPNLLPETVVQLFVDAGRVTILIGQLAMLNIFLTQDLIQTSLGGGVLINKSLNWAGFIAD
ncbi:ABC transporter permease subunit [Bacillaceae bacterium Marseille-Q3522]|nr:ABC transporter permease subunit [Bacillaceae bacterium Marseille-Q3522]